jgi:hypothetical protein
MAALALAVRLKVEANRRKQPHEQPAPGSQRRWHCNLYFWQQ